MGRVRVGGAARTLQTTCERPITEINDQLRTNVDAHPIKCNPHTSYLVPEKCKRVPILDKSLFGGI
jgi:hypothetical protein